MGTPPLSRRALLRLTGAGAVAAVMTPVLAGCDSGKGTARATPRTMTGGREPAAASAVAASAAAAESELIDAYDAVLAVHPSLAARLRSMRDEHAAHGSALLPPTPTPVPSATDAPLGATTAPTDSVPANSVPANSVPADPKAALAWLASRENAAADARVTDLTGLSLSGDGGDAGLARLLASIGGCEAAHAALLDAAGAATGGGT